ncbi:unnamed protein product [Darwinula stevensoni]|uniref:START domain-containing protein n=1 Tax=Darwinula stevensoni TaxID=69355 RepID=A0A7R9FQG9_9CRUS|nr:unnamed protein product [Darwinula stevensoni]CAG0899718.1 unnamed protein product [Darwinula stevensoni]
MNIPRPVFLRVVSKMHTPGVTNLLVGDFVFKTLLLVQDFVFMETGIRTGKKGDWVVRNDTPEAQPQWRMYLDQTEADLKKMMKNLQSADWKHVEHYEGIALYSRFDFESERHLYKFQTIFPYDYEWTLRMTWMTINDSPEWCDDVIDNVILQDLSENCRIFNAASRTQTFGFVSDRDFVSIESYEKVGEVFYWTVSSVTWPDFPLRQGFVRGKADSGGGFVFSPHGVDHKKTLFQLLPMVDPNIPFLPRAITDKLLLPTHRNFVVRLRDRLSYLHSLS